MTFTRSTIEVFFCKFAKFGESTEVWTQVAAHNVEWDQIGVDLRTPTFSFTLLNPGGITRRKWDNSDVVKIYVNKSLEFIGSVNKIMPTKDSKAGQTLQISGPHYYYRVLNENFTNTATENDGGIRNIWRYGRKQNDNGTSAPDMIDGLNPSQILKALTGNKMYAQEFFDNHDNLDDKDWSYNPTEFIDKTSNITNSDFETTVAAVTGTATSGSTTTLVATNKNFATLGIAAGHKVVITAGAGVGQVMTVTSVSTTTNPNDTLNFAAVTTAVNSTSTYSITSWRPFWKTGGVGTTPSSYSGVANNGFTDGGLVGNNPYLGVNSYKIAASLVQMTLGDGFGVYQDNVTLNPGDTLYAYVKSADFNAEIGGLGVRVLLFKTGDSTFSNPITLTAADPIVVSSKYSGVNTTYTRVGGNVNIQQSGTYRIAIMIAWTTASRVLKNALDIRLDNVKLIRTNNFNNVILGTGGFLQLTEVGQNAPLLAENWDVTTARPTPLTSWSQTPNGGTISLVNDPRITSNPAGVTGKAVRLVGGGTNPATISKNLTNVYTKDMSITFYATPSQVNKNSYPIVLIGTDKNGVSRTIRPFVFRSDGKLGYVDQNGAAQTYLNGAAPTSYTATGMYVRLTYIASRGYWSASISDAQFVGNFSFNFTAGTAPITNFTTFQIIAGDSGGAGTLTVDDIKADSLVPPKIYAYSGSCQTKDYFVGSQNIKALPEFTGNFNIKVLAYPYKYNANNAALQYDPTVQIIFKHSTATPSVQTTVATTAVLTPTSITPVNGAGLMQYLYTYAVSALPSPADMARLQFNLTSIGDVSHVGDGLGTPLIDYFLIDADITNYTRQVKYVAGVQTYRAASTGISSDVSAILDYTFPPDLLETPNASFNTVAMEFFQQNLLKSMDDVMQATVKPTTMDNTVLTNLPASTLLYPQDPNWDIRIDNLGKVTFKNHVGQYYGKLAGAKRLEYSFRSRNLTKIATEFDDSEIYNQIVFIGQGIAGQTAISTSTTTTNDYITIKDDASINQYGLKIGRITDKKIFDQYTAVGKAYAALRLHKNPTEKVTVELLPGFADVWQVGDIVYIRDLDEAIDDDFRVLSKRVKADDQGGLKITVELSTKNKTIQSFVAAVGGHLSSLANSNQGSLVSAVGGGVPKVVTRDAPYVVQVSIPDNASQILKRVFLDAHSEALYNTSTITDNEGAHTHSVPGQTFPIQSVYVFATSAVASSANVVLLATGLPWASGTSVSFSSGSPSSTNSFFNNYPGYESFYMVLEATTNSANANVEYYVTVNSSPYVYYTGRMTTAGGNGAFENKYHANILLPRSISNQDFTLKAFCSTSGGSITAKLYGIPDHTHSVNATSTDTSVSTTTGTATAPGSAHNHTMKSGVFYNKNAQNQLLFPTNVNVSVNDIDGIGVIPTTANGGPLVTLMGLGTSETGDILEWSQARNIGFLVQDRDISYAFKDSADRWITGTHYLYFRANGFENQVNDANLGILQASIKYDIVSKTNEDLTAPPSGPQL